MLIVTRTQTIFFYENDNDDGNEDGHILRLLVNHEGSLFAVDYQTFLRITLITTSSLRKLPAIHALNSPFVYP